MRIYILLFALCLSVSISAVAKPLPISEERSFKYFYQTDINSETFPYMFARLESMARTEDISQDAFLTGFLAGIFHTHPEAHAIFMAPSAPKYLQELITVTLALAGHPEKASQYVEHQGLSREKRAKIPTYRTSMYDVPVTIALQDVFWGAFSATGNDLYIEHLIQTADSILSEDGMDKANILHAAVKTLDGTPIEKAKEKHTRNLVACYKRRGNMDELSLIVSLIQAVSNRAAEHESLHQLVSFGSSLKERHSKEMVHMLLATRIYDENNSIDEVEEEHTLILAVSQDSELLDYSADKIENYEARLEESATKHAVHGEPVYVSVAGILAPEEELHFVAQLIDMDGTHHKLSYYDFLGDDVEQTVGAHTVEIPAELLEKPGMYRVRLTAKSYNSDKDESTRGQVAFLVEEYAAPSAK